MQPGRVPKVRSRKCARRATAWCAFSILVLMTPLMAADRTKLKPGWNIFTPEQDVEMGKRLSATAESQLPMLEEAGEFLRVARRTGLYLPRRD
jgi:hypothetical protein